MPSSLIIPIGNIYVVTTIGYCNMGERLSSTNGNIARFSTRIDAPLPVTYSWKGKTFQQVVSAMQHNGDRLQYDASSNYAGMGPNVLLPQPIRHYRREIASAPVSYPKQPRSLVSIDEFNRPGGTYMSPTGYTPVSGAAGLDKFSIDAKEAGEVNNTTEHPGLCKAGPGPCLDRATLARRRCRTSGIMKTSYNADTRGYLNNRNKSFEANSYQYLQKGSTSAEPGTAAASSNSYRTQSYMNATAALYDVSGCNPPITNVYYKPNNWRFSQQGGVESSSYTLRRKFDSVTNNTAVYRRVYGDAVANAMGYGIADSVYTYKGKVGYPLPKRPKMLASIFRCCTDNHIAGGMRGVPDAIGS
jgi:hypothetical protein